MKLVPIGRREFLRGRFFARLSGGAFHDTTLGGSVEAPADAHAPSAPVVLGFAPRSESDRAPFARRREARAALVSQPMLARVDRFACLASPASVCRVCVEHCPVDGAIVIRDGRPVVDATLCDGCGRCEQACPAPFGAIRVLPSLPTVARAAPRGI